MVVSRATWFDDGFDDMPVVRLPVVAGRTVWDTFVSEPGWQHVVEQPNYFGLFERPPIPGSPITVERWVGADNVGSVVTVDTGLSADAWRAARKLAGRLRQIPGVKLPHGSPESPWLVVSLPGDAAAAAAAVSAEGFRTASSLGTHYPEFPGGMRIEVAWPEQENELFARAIETVLEV